MYDQLTVFGRMFYPGVNAIPTPFPTKIYMMDDRYIT